MKLSLGLSRLGKFQLEKIESYRLRKHIIMSNQKQVLIINKLRLRDCLGGECQSLGFMQILIKKYMKILELTF